MRRGPSSQPVPPGSWSLELPTAAQLDSLAETACLTFEARRIEASLARLHQELAPRAVHTGDRFALELPRHC